MKLKMKFKESLKKYQDIINKEYADTNYKNHIINFPEISSEITIKAGENYKLEYILNDFSINNYKIFGYFGESENQIGIFNELTNLIDKDLYCGMRYFTIVSTNEAIPIPIYMNFTSEGVFTITIKGNDSSDMVLTGENHIIIPSVYFFTFNNINYS